ncbi:probable G-protein coupled receptor Mth-like 3 isoform X2 [Cydia pomonella]|uniref:probable G-protein coupled receptor Mth-like 3 isoform X2 n=1 Tax=Cydia pomonella TaxID=82600 RepID=UPI002ADE4AEA|nr:probable G-protein coupled receptor Mth-like 3 isoform X2 [Cydia pomonella]
MWLSIMCLFALISAKCVSSELTVFHKCCAENQSLVKITDANETSIFKCESRELNNLKYEISTSPLIISDDIEVIYGMPAECEEEDIVELKTEGMVVSTSQNNSCYDRIVLEVRDGELKSNIPRTVVLKCNFNETENATESVLHIDRIRKCCPANHTYDTINNVCTRMNEVIDEKWLVREIKSADPRIFEVDTGIHCKETQFAIDLMSEEFSLHIYGSSLFALRKTMTKEQRVGEGEWCMDRRKDNIGLVARVCANDASLFGAYPIRKCCPVGEHYKVLHCKSTKSVCVRNTDHEIIFNMSIYLDPLREEYKDFPDLLGIRTSIRCPSWKYVTNKENPLDQHSLNLDGTLQQVRHKTEDNYCLEEFDRRHCHDDNPIEVAAVLCFVGASETEKNFYLSFVLNTISAVCLGLTFLVYVSLPELRNLHGRTLICHSGTMLLAFSFLARVQYDKVEDHLCVLFGYMIYFGFVSAFAWLNVMCLDIWWTFGNVRTVHPLRKSGADCRRFLWYSLYAWSFAIVLTLTMFLLDKYPVAKVLDANIGAYICWFGTRQNSDSDWPHYIFFVIPMGLVTCTNFVLWVLTARHCARVKSEVHRLQAGSVGDRAKRRFRVDKAKYILTGKLWVVMGAGWLVEMLSTMTSNPRWLWEIMDRINELQGVFIFFILIMKPKLYYLIRKRLGLEKPDALKNGTSSSGRTSSTFLSRTISTDERTNLRTSLPECAKKA